MIEPSVVAHGCTWCGEIVLGALYARLGPETWACAECWHNAHMPISQPAPATLSAIFEQEQKTRERMLARGGTDRHLARTGLS